MTKPLNKAIVLIRGAGEMATGVGWTLARAGYRVVMTEVSQPLMVRWPVCFGTAVEEKRWEVEGIPARHADQHQDCSALWQEGIIPILIDPKLEILKVIQPDVLIDAIMAKRNVGTRPEMAPLTIGLGPGFSARQDVHLVIETNRGHDLGRLIYKGFAEPNTGVPGEIGGATQERVVYAPISGIFKARKEIGDQVLKGDVLGEISGQDEHLEVLAGISGVLRGLLRHETWIEKGVKAGDIDPRGEKSYCWTISEKARTIGGAVLLGIAEWEYYHN